MFEDPEELARRLLAATPTGSDEEGRVEVLPDLDPAGSWTDRLVALERVKAAAEAEQITVMSAVVGWAQDWLDRDDAESRRLSADPADRIRHAHRRPCAEDIVADQIAPALHLSPTTAASRANRAVRMVTRLSGTVAALRRGDLDVGRALAIDQATAVLGDAIAARVEERVLPGAVDQTAAELRAALRKAVIAIDPHGAEQRRRQAVKERSVERYARDDGMSVIQATLSAIDSGEIYDLIDEVARRTKTTDDSRSMDQRRADAYVLLLLNRDPHLGPEDPPTPDPAVPPTDPEDGPPDPVDDDIRSAEGEPVRPDDSRTEDDPVRPDDTSTDEAPVRPDDSWTDDDPVRPDDSLAGDDPVRPGDSLAGDDLEPPDPASESDTPPPDRDQTVHTRSHPTSDVTSDSTSGGRTDTDDPGMAEPPDLDERFPPDSDPISELAALALSAMVCRRPPELPWVAINTAAGSDGATVHVGELQGYGPITAEYARHLLSTGAARAPDRQTTREPTEIQARTHDPPGWLDREVRARGDGTCRFPGCRRAAHRIDLDHTVPFPHGLTVRTNLGGLCRRHHRTKTAGVWGLVQDPGGTGIMTWISQVSRERYTTYPRGVTGGWRGARAA